MDGTAKSAPVIHMGPDDFVLQLHTYNVIKYITAQRFSIQKQLPISSKKKNPLAIWRLQYEELQKARGMFLSEPGELFWWNDWRSSCKFATITILSANLISLFRIHHLCKKESTKACRGWQPNATPQSAALGQSQGFVNSFLGNSAGWWADTTATLLPGK